jgi:hypothetical protein
MRLQRERAKPHGRNAEAIAQRIRNEPLQHPPAVVGQRPRDVSASVCRALRGERNRVDLVTSAVTYWPRCKRRSHAIAAR